MKKSILYGFIAVVVGVLIVRPLAMRRKAKISHSPTHSSLRPLQPFRPAYTSKQWQKSAKAFDKNKASAAALFAAATKVECFRLFPNGKEAAGPSIQGFISYGKSATQSQTFAARLGAIVLDPKTYLLPGQSTKQCYFEPGVAFRVWKGKQYADTVMCFHCNQLAVVENNPKVPMNSIGSSLRGRIYVMGDFDVRACAQTL